MKKLRTSSPWRRSVLAPKISRAIVAEQFSGSHRRRVALTLFGVNGSDGTCDVRAGTFPRLRIVYLISDLCQPPFCCRLSDAAQWPLRLELGYPTARQWWPTGIDLLHLDGRLPAPAEPLTFGLVRDCLEGQDIGGDERAWRRRWQL
jgi:hypothetical protein